MESGNFKEASVDVDYIINKYSSFLKDIIIKLLAIKTCLSSIGSQNFIKLQSILDLLHLV